MKSPKPIESISDLEKYCVSILKKSFESQEPAHGIFTVKRFQIKQFTDSATFYFLIVKKLQEVIDCHVCRNPSCIEIGIYISSKSELVDAYIEILQSIIEFVEYKNTQYGTYTLSDLGLYRKGLITDYKSKLIMKCLIMVFDLLDFRKSIQPDEARNYYLLLNVNLQTFVKENSQTRNLKRFYSKLSFIPRNLMDREEPEN